MNILKNVGEYINVHLFGYRYDYEIIKYFNEPYRNAILTLYQEGYPVNKEYDRLLNDYKAIYRYFNSEELSYCLNHPQTIDSMFELGTKEKISLRRTINSNATCILALNTKNTSILFEYKSKINLLSMQSEILSKKIQKINPIYNAVLIRKMVKLIEEKLIYNFINLFDIQNYTPLIDQLLKYKERINKLPNSKSNENIITKIDKEIIALKKQNSISTKNEKSKPKIKYISSNKITKIHKTLNIIRIYCNSIIHFDPNKGVDFNLDNSFLENVNISDNNKKKETLNEIYFGNNQKKINLREYYIDISKSANYIANSNISNELLDKLIKLKKDLENQINSINNLLNQDSNQVEINNSDFYVKKKKQIMNNYELAKETITTLKVPKFIEDLKKDEIQNIITYIKLNQYDIKEININIDDKIEKKNLKKINNELKKMDVYSRIKFNITFERDLELIEFYNELKSYITSIKSNDKIINTINEYKNKFKEIYQKLKEECKLINDSIIAFDFTKVFQEVNANDFVEFLSNQFKNIKIDLFGKEINNIFLYIFLLKKNIFNEIAFKTTEGINDE